MSNLFRRRRFSLFSVGCTLCLLTSAGLSQEQKQSADKNLLNSDTPPLEELFSDSFTTDSRGDYTIDGEVAWQDGQLQLSNGASIERSLQASPWVRLELDLEPIEFRQGTTRSELQVWFAFDSATRCYARLKQELKDRSRSTSVGMFDTAIPSEGNQGLARDPRTGLIPGLTRVRESDLGKVKSERIRIEYRYGMVRISFPEGPTFIASVENGDAEVISVSLKSRGTSAKLNRFAASTTKSQTRVLSEAEKQQLAKAEDSEQERNELLRQNRPAEAARAAELDAQALEIRQSLFGARTYSHIQRLTRLADLYRKLGDYDRAKPLFVQAMQIARSVLGEQHVQYGVSLNNLAKVLEQSGDYAGAERRYQQSLPVLKLAQGERSPNYAICLSNLAEIHRVMGRYDRAKSVKLEALELLKSSLGEEHPAYVAALGDLAILFDQMGDYTLAEAQFKESIRLVKSALGERHPVYARDLSGLAHVYNKLGDYARAEELHQQGLRITKLVLGEQHEDYAIKLANTAQLYGDLGEYARAEELLMRSLQITKSTLGDMHPYYATLQQNLAALYSRLGEHARAMELFDQSLQVYKRVLGEQHPKYAMMLSNKAQVQISKRDFARAEALLKQALEIGRASWGEQSPQYATLLGNMARLILDVGDFKRSESAFLQAVRINKSLLGEKHPAYFQSLFGLAGSYSVKGDYAQAKPLAVAARDAQLVIAGQLLPGLSAAQARGWMAKKSPSTDLLLSVLRAHDSESPEAYASVWNTKLMLSRLQVGRELPPDASPEVIQVFNRLRDAKLKLARVVSATPTAEQAEAYRQALSKASEQKEALEKELARLNLASRRELAIRDATIDDLLERIPAGVAVIDFARSNDWELVDEQVEVKKDDGQTELKTITNTKNFPLYDAFVLRPDQRPAPNTPARWIELGPAEPIEQAIDDWRQAIASFPSGPEPQSTAGSPSPDVHANHLRELIWDKLEKHLDGIHTIVVIPDGALHRLPWGALPGRESGQFLINDYALTTASSGQQLFGILSDPAIATEPNLLVAGGIQYDERSTPQPTTPQPSIPTPTDVDGPTLLAARSRTLDVSDEQRSWQFLEGTVKEVSQVEGLWEERGPVKRLAGSQAEERTLASLLPQSRFAHLATHGFFDTKGEVYRVNLREQSLFESSQLSSQRSASIAARNPLLMTGIVMAGANVPPDKDELGLPAGDDGILTAEEISGLDLRNTELVALSACETGLGDVAAGQGVFGLSRALHQAGVRSVVSSLWKVDDAATQALMTEFYRNLWQRNLPKVEALRQAQLTMIAQFDPRSGQLRGLRPKSEQVAATASDPAKATPPQATASKSPLPPFFWAAFQLSGDWR